MFQDMKMLFERRGDMRSAGAPLPNSAKRLESAQLAPAFNDARRSAAGASSAHSKRFARCGCVLAGMCLAFTLASAAPLRAADTLNWNTNRDLVTADIKSTGLLRVLESVASVTGWKVFLEPETIHTVSAKFKNLPPGEALHLLLGDVNFALIPESGQATKLYVFHTSQQNATMLVHPVKPGEEAAKARRIPNELLVTLKPGAKIDELARLLGAKVIGHIPNSNAYRLQFDSEDAANAARSQPTASPDVTSVNDNYVIDRPPDAR